MNANPNDREIYPETNPHDLAEQVNNALWQGYFDANGNPNAAVMQPVITLGMPGCAKTQWFENILAQIWALFLTDTTGEEVTVREIAVIVIHSALRDAQEMSGPGVPNPREDGSIVFDFSVPPTIAEMERMYWTDDEGVDHGCRYFILIFDEVASAREDQQMVAQRAFDNIPRLGDTEAGFLNTETRKVLVVGTGNRMEDKAGAKRLLTSLADRAEIFTMKFLFAAWREWAEQNGVPAIVIAWMEQEWEQVLAKAVPRFDGPYATPRSVTNASYKLSAFFKRNAFDGTIPGWLKRQIAANIGDKAMTSLCDFIEKHDEVPAVTEVFDDPDNCLLSDNLGYQEIAGRMVLHAITTAYQAEQALTYIERMRRDIQVVLGCTLQDIIAAPEFDDSISSSRFQDFNDRFEGLIGHVD